MSLLLASTRGASVIVARPSPLVVLLLLLVLLVQSGLASSVAPVHVLGHKRHGSIRRSDLVLVVLQVVHLDLPDVSAGHCRWILIRVV